MESKFFKVLLCLAVSLFFMPSTMSAARIEAHLTNAGTLKDVDNIKSATELVVTGPMNEADFAFIHSTLKSLTSLDLSQVTLQLGTPANKVYGEGYFHSDGNINFESYEDENIQYKLYYSPKNETKLDMSERAYILCFHIYTDNLGFFFLQSEKLTDYKLPPVTNLTSELPALVAKQRGYTSYVNGMKASYNVYPFAYPAMEKVTVPSSVTKISGSPFSHCKSLKELVVAADNPVYDSRGKCNGIVETASNTLVAGCRMTVIPEGVTAIGKDAFRESDVEYIVIPQSVKKIDARAFAGCKKLSTVIFKGGTAELGDSCFAGCTSLEIFALPGSVTKLGDCCFAGCTALREIEMPAGLKTIGKRAFENCSALPAITLPDGVAALGERTFRNCKSLKTVTLPASLTTIGGDCFIDCSSLAEVAVPDKVTTIGANAFKGCKQLSSLTLGCSVAAIGENAFSGCAALDGVSLPASLRSIGEKAFENCASLSEVLLPEQFEELGANAFVGCTELTKVVVPASLTTLSKQAFKNCTSLTDVALPAGMTMVGEETFAGCTALKTIDLPSTVTTLGRGAFSGCSALESVNLPEGLTVIVGDLFADCVKLSPTVTIPSKVTAINARAFQGCTRLKTMTLPDGVTAIYNDAFSGCSSLQTISLPASLTQTKYHSFYRCSALKQVDYRGTVEQWMAINFDMSADTRTVYSNPLHYAHTLLINGEPLTTLVVPNYVATINDLAFYGCHDLTEVRLHPNVVSVGNYAFNDCPNLTAIYSAVANPIYAYHSNNTYGVLENKVFDIHDGLTVYIPVDQTFVYRTCKSFNGVSDFVEQESPAESYDANIDGTVNGADVSKMYDALLKAAGKDSSDGSVMTNDYIFPLYMIIEK